MCSNPCQIRFELSSGVMLDGVQFSPRCHIHDNHHNAKTADRERYRTLFRLPSNQVYVLSIPPRIVPQRVIFQTCNLAVIHVSIVIGTRHVLGVCDFTLDIAFQGINMIINGTRYPPVDILTTNHYLLILRHRRLLGLPPPDGKRPLQQI